MTRNSRILVIIYTAVALWLAYCTLTTWGDAPLWTSITMTAASVVPLVAALREAEHVDELRIIRRQLERAARPIDTTPPADGIVAIALAGACCDAWWATAGDGHDPTCRRHTPRSSAA